MVFKKIFIWMLALWMIISVFDVFYNSIKFVSEARHWLPLSDEQKRVEVYGNVYNFLKFIEKNTPKKSSVLIYSKDDKAYYLGRYILYPRYVSVYGISYSNDLRINKFDYIASDSNINSLDNYYLIISDSGYFIFKYK